jgi:hypothetical protein
MAIEMHFENLGQLAIAKGQTVNVNWELFPGELAPLIDHTSIFGFDSARHIVRVSLVAHEGGVPGGTNNSSFHYSVTNISAGPAQVNTSQRYIFFKVT